MQILANQGMDKDSRIIRELYWNKMAEIKVNNEAPKEIVISKEVRQGWVLTPLLFNIYIEAIFEETLNKEDGGI